MNEMLANNYFMTRKFREAVPLLEEELYQHPENIKIAKKLIIGYTRTGKVEQGLSLFYTMIKNDPFYIIDTDHYEEDCPCPEIIDEMLNEKEGNENSSDYFNSLGMLYLYCDLKKSIEQFRTSYELKKEQSIIHSVIKILSGLSVDDKIH